MSDLLILATEAAEADGGVSPRTIAIIILLVALAGFTVAYVVVGPGRRRAPKRRGDIPLSMRPYHSDEELETTGLERAMAWGVALTVFMAVFLPVYWLIEPVRIQDKQEEFYAEDVEAGRELYAQNCVQCHGEDAGGGTAPHPDPEVDAPWPAPALDNIAARYEDSDLVTDVEEFMTQTIKQGRDGTPMPAWGTAYQGPMNDLQIQQIVEYLLAIQTGQTPEAQAFPEKSGEQLFMDNCARCHGFDAEGRVGPELTTVFARFGAAPGDEQATGEAREAIASTIRTGRERPTGANMPSWDDKLTDGAIDRIIRYLRSIQTVDLSGDADGAGGDDADEAGTSAAEGGGTDGAAEAQS